MGVRNRALTADNTVHETIPDINRVSIENLKWQIRYSYAKSRARGAVLDVACGRGHGSIHFDTYTGVDISEESVAAAVSSYPGKTFIVGDALDLPFPDSTFDSVVSLETIEHLHEQEAFVKELSRVIKPGGTLILSTPNPNRYHNPYHVREIPFSETVSLISDHFSVEESVGYSFPWMVRGYFVYEAALTVLLWMGFSPRFVKRLLLVSKRMPKRSLNYLLIATSQKGLDKTS
jgi:SAM-dependent methyltransferase